MAKYRINYGRVVGQANDISDLASDLGKEITKMENHLETVRSEWNGPASDEYQKQLKSLIASMKSTRKKINSLSASIKSVAYSIQKTDEELAKKAKESADLNMG